ncbi:hypothetical protein F4777DRAFT_576799 [Nemania sp. FL0916]|nr:hypothetical protein F4777DRAFT_576799 [Nemania sp. FL0916]
MFRLPWSRKSALTSFLIVSSHSISSSNAIALDKSLLDAGPPPALPTDCLNNSFAAPTWTVESFSYNTNGKISTVNFLLNSNTISEQLDCFGQVGDDPSVDGDCISEDDEHLYSAQFTYEVSSRQLSLHQEWSCDSENPDGEPVIFVGTGSQKLALTCTSNTCTSTDVIRIPITLSQPIALSPYIPPAPPGHNTPGCGARSDSPSWTVSGFEWRTGGRNYTWQSWVSTGWAIAGVGLVKLNLTNSANQQTFSCQIVGRGHEVANVTIIDPPSGSIPFPTDPGIAWFPCDTHSVEEGGNYTHNYEVETLVRVVAGEDRIFVNQTWYCDDEGAASPAKFYAVGETTLPSLACSERLALEPGIAELFFTDPGTPLINGSICTTSSPFSLPGSLQSQYPMDPYALSLPNPLASHCTTTSFDPAQQYFVMESAYAFRPNWWYFWRGDAPQGGMDFTLRILVFADRTFGCSGFDPRLNPNSTAWDPEFWFECKPLVSDPPAYKGVKVNYNPDTGLLSAGMTWSCEELSPGNP